MVPDADDMYNVVQDIARDKVLEWTQTAATGYVSVVRASIQSSYSTAALQLNSSLYLVASTNSIKQSVASLATKQGALKAGKSLGKDFAVGIITKTIDKHYDRIEDKIYKNTIITFRKLIRANKEAKGITIIAQQA